MFLPQSRSILGRRSITRPSLWQLGITVCSTLITASTYIIIAHTLHPQAFGTYMFVQWLASVTLPIIGIGMSTLTSRRAVEIQSNEAPKQSAGIFYFLWYRQCRCVLLYYGIYLGSTLLLTWAYGFHAPLLLLLAGLATLPLLLSSVASIALRSLHRSDLLMMLHLFGILSTFMLVMIASHIDGEHSALLLLASAMATTLTLIIAVTSVSHLLPMSEAIQPGLFLKERLLRVLKHSPLLFTLDFITWQRSELLLLACWRSPVELGFYALSSAISTGTMQIAPTLLSHWILPVFLRYTPGKHYLNTYDAFVKTSCATVFLAVPICIFVMITCPFIITFCLGVDYLPLVKPLRILLIATVFGSTATVSLTHLTSQEHKHEQQWLNMGVAILKIMLVLPCISLWGMAGAALASAIAQIVSAGGSMLLCRYLLLKYEITT